MKDAIQEIIGSEVEWTFLLRGGHVIKGIPSADYETYFTLRHDNRSSDDLSRVSYDAVVAFK